MKKIISFVLTLLVFLTFSISVNAYSGMKTVRVGFFNSNGYHMAKYNDDGDLISRSGYGYEYILEIAKYANWKLEYVDTYTYIEDGVEITRLATWSDALLMLKNGDVDILTSASHTTEREKYFAYSNLPLGYETAVITVLDDNGVSVISDYSALNGFDIGVAEDNSFSKSLREFSTSEGFSYNEVVFESEEELRQKLKNKEIDAILTSNLHALENERIIAEFNPQPYYAIVRNDRNDSLYDELNRALERIYIENPTFSTSIYEKYYASTTDIFFNYYESNYLKERRQLVVGLPPLSSPLLEIDNGKIVGIIPDIISEIASTISLNIEYKTYNSIRDYIYGIENNEFDIAGLMYNNAHIAESQGAMLTTSYMNAIYKTITLRKNNQAPKTIAMVKDSYIRNLYAEDIYDSSNIKYYSNENECAEAVKKGYVEGAILTSYVADKIISSDVTNSFSSANIYNYSTTYAMGVLDDESNVLFLILNRAINNLSDERIDEIISKYAYVAESSFSLKSLIYSNPVEVTSIISVFCFLLVLFFVLLFYYFRKRKESILLNEVANFAYLLCSTYTEVVEIDLSKDKVIFYCFVNDEFHVVDSKQTITGMIDKFKEDWVHPDDIEMYSEKMSMRNFMEISNEKKSLSFEVRIMNEDGSYHWTSYYLYKMQCDKVHPNNLLMYKLDIDETKKEEENQKRILKDALIMAENASLTKTQFLSRMSHEIRTPLNAIVGFLELIRENIENVNQEIDEKDRNKINNYLEKATFSSKHLNSLLNDILDMSAIENKRLKLVSEEVEILSTLKDIYGMFINQAINKDVKLEFKTENLDNVVVRCDVRRLRQVLINLLSNALKFTPNNGKIIFNASLIHIGKKLGHFQFIIEDTGIGMSEDFIAKIGEPFEQQNASIAKNYGGNGLGLSISKNLISMMRGKMTVESKIGEGTKFIIDLPLQICNRTGDIQQASRVLIIDKCSPKAIEEMLAEYKVEMYEVKNLRKIYEDVTKTIKETSYNLYLISYDLIKERASKIINQLKNIALDEKKIIFYVSNDTSEEELKEIKEEHKVDVSRINNLNIFTKSILSFGEKERIKALAKNKHIILAEDNELNLEIANEILSDLGFIVDTARNGKEAYEKFAESKINYYSFILMDIQMPVMNGYEATRVIRSLDREDSKNIGIIAVTANVFAEYIAEALASGMNDIISKPFVLDRVYDILIKYLQ